MSVLEFLTIPATKAIITPKECQVNNIYTSISFKIDYLAGLKNFFKSLKNIKIFWRGTNKPLLSKTRLKINITILHSLHSTCLLHIFGHKILLLRIV